MASLAELTHEILDSPECVAEHINVAGEEVVRAAMNLGQLFGTDQDVKSSDTALNASLPTISSSSSIRSYYAHMTPHQPHILPQLPPIKNAALAHIPFRHQGTVRSQENTSANASYERLEFLGDAYLEIIATRLIYSRFAHLPAGRMSQVREALVKNETLAEYAVGYGFDRKAQLPSSHQDPGKLWTKTMGDIFEAYVAAVILADPKNGFNTVEAWLNNLWAPKLVQQNIAPKPNVNAKQDLARKIMGKDIRVSYVDEGKPEVVKKEGKTYYHIGVYLTGWGWKNQHLGSGRGLNKAEAGTQAAMEALANTLLIDEIAAVKQAYDIQVREQRAHESSLEHTVSSKQKKN